MCHSTGNDSSKSIGVVAYFMFLVQFIALSSVALLDDHVDSSVAEDGDIQNMSQDWLNNIIICP